MATLLGYTIANDKDTITKRQESPLGYTKQDEQALIEFGILIKSKDNTIVRNSKLGISSGEIRDFLNWVVGKRNPPLPNLVRKILCLKRARIINSMESVGTSPALRTKEGQMIAEIDALLRDDGVTNPEDKTKCMAQSAGKYDSNAGAKEAMANAKSTNTDSVSTTSTSTITKIGEPGAPCTTVVNCDSSVVLSEMKKIQESLESLHTILPISSQANTISGMAKDIQAFNERAKENQEASPIVKITNEALVASENGKKEDLIKLINDMPAEVKSGEVSPIAAEAAAANLKMIKDKEEDLPENTKKNLDDMINKLNKQASTITEPIVAFRVQLDNLADVVKNQPAKIEEEVKELLPKIKDQYVAVAIKFEEEMKDELEKIGKQIDDSTADIRTNIASIKPVDYEPQFKHLDDSVRTMYDTLQKLIAEDYSRRFDELNKKIDDLTGLMNKCCKAVESNAKPTLNINNNNSKGTITPIEETSEFNAKPTLSINDYNNEGTITPIEEESEEESEPEVEYNAKPTLNINNSYNNQGTITRKKIKKVALPNLNNYLIPSKPLKEEQSTRRLIDQEPKQVERTKLDVPEYEEEKQKPSVKRVIYQNNNFPIAKTEQLKEEQSARRLIDQEPKQVERTKQEVPDYEDESIQKPSVKRVIYQNNNFPIAKSEQLKEEQSARRLIDQEPKQIERTKQDVPEYEEEDREVKTKKSSAIPVTFANNNFSIQPKEKLKEEESSRRLIGEPQKISSDKKVNTTMNNSGLFQFTNSESSGESEPEPAPEPETKQETEAVSKQNFGPTRPRRKPTKKEIDEIVSSTKSNLVLGKGKENRSVDDLTKSLKVVLKREGNLGKNLNLDDKVKSLVKLQKAYEKGEEGEDFDNVKPMVDEFLEGFNSDGQFKRKLKDHAKELNEKQWVVYLRNLFNAIDEYSQRIKSPQSQGTKKIKSFKTISKRNTRKLRR